MQLSSTVALVLAAIVAVTLHEASHAVAGLLRGTTPTLYPNAVSYSPDPSRSTQLVTAATGPLFSLVLGLGLYAGGRSVGRGFGRLFVLWLSLVSLQIFSGYLMIAPIARAGDTGKVLDLLGAPGPVYVVVAVLGAVLTLVNSRLLAGQVVRYARGDDELRHTVIFPWLVGTGVVVLLTLLNQARVGLDPETFPIVLAAAVAIAIFAPMFTFFYSRIRRTYERLALPRPVLPMVVTGVLALLVFLVLAPGVQLG